MIKLKAFTLLETIITLCISVIVLQVSLWFPKDFLHDQELKNFKLEANRRFNVLKEEALINDEQLLVLFDRDNQRITVKNLRTQVEETILEFPKFLNLIKNTQLRIYGEGGISPVSISFRDRSTNEIYHLKLQMGWGSLSFEKI